MYTCMHDCVCVCANECLSCHILSNDDDAGIDDAGIDDAFAFHVLRVVVV